MIAAVELPSAFQQQLRAEALRALPRECCGLLEGTAENSLARVSVLHQMRNAAAEADRFEIDPAQHIALLRNLRGTERMIIGCYHSHPNGRAEPSARDRESAAKDDFLWLIVAVEAETRATRLAAFVSSGQSFSPIHIARVSATAGACGLT